jgi:tetraacyldisaccharide 4'-kinase
MASIEKYWYEPNPVSVLLLPLAWLFCSVVILRRFFYRAKIIKPEKLPVPVIVVGNITVGGTGKTPLVAAITEHLKRQGYKPGIVSRGYGGKAATWPQAVTENSDPMKVGDEAVLLAQRCQCPTSVGPDRPHAARALLDAYDCDVIVSDDGLQHYALHRDIEVVVIDGSRGFGNGRCLPAGPLREPAQRVLEADFVVTNVVTNVATNVVTNTVTNTVTNADTIVVDNGGETGEKIEMRLHMQAARNLKQPLNQKALAEFVNQTVHAVAGIGNPSRFFNQLKSMGIRLIEHPFMDHHVYTADELCFNDDLPVLMTEKDAVKCREFVQEHFWHVPVTAEINKNFLIKLTEQLRKSNG